MNRKPWIKQMQREDPQGAPGSPQAPSAFKGVEVYPKKGKSSLLQYWDTMLKDFFPNKLHIPVKTQKNLLKGQKGRRAWTLGGKKKSTFIINKQKLCSSSLYPQLHTWLSLIRPWSQEQTASVSTVTIVFKVKITFPVWALMEQGMATQVAQTSPWQLLGPSNTRSQTWLRFSDLPGRDRKSVV